MQHLRYLIFISFLSLCFSCKQSWHNPTEHRLQKDPYVLDDVHLYITQLYMHSKNEPFF